MKLTALVSIALSLCAAGATSHAAPPSHCVVLSGAVCTFPSLDRRAFHHALRVELASAGFELQELACPSWGILVTVEPVGCEEAARELEIVVTGPDMNEPSTRRVPTGDLSPAMMTRTLALATAETVARAVAEAEAPSGAAPPSTPTSDASSAAPVAPGSAVEPTPPPAPVLMAPPLGPPAVVGVPPSPPRRLPSRPRGVIGALAEYRSYFAPSTELFGGRVSSAWGMALDGLELRADVFFAQTNRDVALGRVAVDAVAAAGGAQWVTRGAPLTIFVGSTAEVGYAWTAGRPNGAAEGGRGGRATIALVADAGARFALAPAWLVLLEGGGGVELAGFRALVDDVAVGGVSGAYVLVHAGVGYAF